MIAPYARIADEIRQRIATGDLRPGDLVPSARQITREFGVALATATKALAVLRTDGLVRPIPGVGTVVAEPPTTQAPPGRAPTGPASTRPASAGQARIGTAPSSVSTGQPPIGTAPSSVSTGQASKSTAAIGTAPTVRRPRVGEHDLTRERVVRAAIAIADDEGLAGLSMRRLATDLAVATMSLYRHVPNKDVLVLSMVDAVFGDVPPPAERPPGWRAQLEALARRQWDGYRAHPWLASVVSMTRPQLVPNGIAHTEWALQALDSIGLDPSAKLHAVVTLLGYVRGTATSFESQAQQQQDTGVTDEEWMDAHDSSFTEYFTAGPYPMLARLSRTPVDLDLDSLFEFGLTSLLDGYERRFARSSRCAP